MYLDKSPEYWVGWALSYYQWESALDYRTINNRVSVAEIYGMYITSHEADISHFVSIMNEKCMSKMRGNQLRRLRSYARLSQKQLADLSGVPLRQIQLFEQGQRDIHKTQAATLIQLSSALQCDSRELMD